MQQAEGERVHAFNGMRLGGPEARDEFAVPGSGADPAAAVGDRVEARVPRERY